MNANGPDNRADVYSVSRLTTELRAVVEQGFPLLWVAGEISNLSRPRSGHLYFSLKDPHAQVRCALFRGTRSRLRTEPDNGQQVLVRARPSVYEPRGDLQLIVEHLEPAGAGALHEAFERLKRKLDAEGLFDPARKRPLPPFPGRVGVITSTSGAALRDVLNVLAARFPALAVRVYPTQVQGDAAPAALRAALQLALARRDCDLLLLTRGGGSIEDLWAFNDEALARDIAAATVPIVSAVGHETDFTIADFVADRRAPTPSAGAELISPDGRALAQRLDDTAHRLGLRQRQRQQTLAQRLDQAAGRLIARHPRQWLLAQRDRLHALGQRTRQAQRLHRAACERRLLDVRHRLLLLSPRTQLQRRLDRTDAIADRLVRSIRERLRVHRQCLAALSRQLDTVSPLRTLDRGYAIARDVDSGTVLRAAAQAEIGARVALTLADGTLITRVEDKE